MVSMFTGDSQHGYRLGKYTYRMREPRLENLGNRIAEKSKARDWTQQDLADRLKLSRPTVTQWESGKTKNIRLGNLLALAKVFDISLIELLLGIEEPFSVQEPSGRYETNEDESMLLDRFRALPAKERAILLTIADLMRH